MSTDTQTTDDALMRRLARRDAEALRIIIQRYGQVPFRISSRILNDRSAAEDVAQEALLRLWRKAVEWKSGTVIPAWLTRVATNLCIDEVRRTRRLTEEDEAPEREDDALPADIDMIKQEMARATRECIDELPVKARAAIVLTYYEQQSNKSAASLLGIKLKAFETLLFRARRVLQGCVEGKGVLKRDVREMGT